MTLKILALGGDGIGPEVVDAEHCNVRPTFNHLYEPNPNPATSDESSR